MGDRSNIAILQSDHNQVWFYGHWAGSHNAAAVHQALNRKVRWTDESYLARIIWDSFCPAKDQGEDGYGISCTMQDNEHTIVVVDIPKQRVFLIDETDLDSAGQVPQGYVPPASQRWTFEEFASLTKLPKV